MTAPFKGDRAGNRPLVSCRCVGHEGAWVDRPLVYYPSGALTWGLGGLVALDQSSVTGLRKRSKSNIHRTGE